jgi:hypothetical protein
LPPLADIGKTDGQLAQASLRPVPIVTVVQEPLHFEHDLLGAAHRVTTLLQFAQLV